MHPSHINVLPEELLLYVFEHLDASPPSEVKSRQEPSLQLVRSEHYDLKNLSCVSRDWRRIVLPWLFKHSCVRLDDPRPRGGAICSICGLRSQSSPVEPYDVDSYHLQMMTAINGLPEPPSNLSAILQHKSRSEAKTAWWALQFYHVMQDYLNFIQKEQIASSIRSFVLLSDRMLSKKLARFPHEVGPREWRYPAAAALWNHLLSFIDPKRISILAPPIEMACLTNAAIDTFGVSHAIRSLKSSKVRLHILPP